MRPRCSGSTATRRRPTALPGPMRITAGREAAAAQGWAVWCFGSAACYTAGRAGLPERLRSFVPSTGFPVGAGRRQDSNRRHVAPLNVEGLGRREVEEMLMRNGDRIVQMIPAAGYYAAYRDGDELTYNPVAVWVVIEDQKGGQRVDGVDPSGEQWDGLPCSSRKGFVEFVYRDERERRR